jgi:GDP-4-dehydro-6-deoxy-D-mannose reductase
MKPRRIMVTGAAGFVGRHLMPAIAARFPEAAVTEAAFDVTERDAVLEAVRAERPDACIHLAAIAAIPAARQDPGRAWAVNLHGTLSLAEALLSEVPDCLLVYASSADAYGASFRSGQNLTEDAPLAPVNVYGATKAAADLALGAMAATGLRVVRVRPFNHTGAGQSEDFVTAAFARQIALIAAGKQPPVLHVGDLSPVRDFLDVRDVCAGYVACIDRAEQLPQGAILNLASGVPRGIADVLEDLMQAAGVRAEVRADPARMRPSDIPVACGDAGRARALLGWTPSIPWSDTVAAVARDWHDRVSA